MNRLNKSNHIVFVNKRLVSWKKLSKNVQTLYRNLVHKKFKTFLFLDLQLKSDKIDVNVHPKKEEILMLNEVVTILNLYINF